MRKIKDVLRLKLDAKLSHQQIADALGLSKGVVTKYVGLAAAAALDWAAVQSLDEAALERRLLVGSQ
ncbi:IS21 family transposase, partial [Undibacterium sp. CCC2.1]|nr:IS21 family transposase [Undibacterium sp. CCC2.1]MEB0172530.1 IS21 family transposase [Undibacterium sp. CCC1.1]MEB0177679.1 IS21 family transposase [Undibacterium sp. CCC3.4]MEB0215598.1 IS21 family transposase [Undibacterium sp. 5I2]